MSVQQVDIPGYGVVYPDRDCCGNYVGGHNAKTCIALKLAETVSCLTVALENQRECTRAWVWKAEHADRVAGLDCHGVGHNDGSQLCRECLLHDKMAAWALVELEFGYERAKELREKHGHIQPGLWRKVVGAWRELKVIFSEMAAPL